MVSVADIDVPVAGRKILLAAKAVSVAGEVFMHLADVLCSWQTFYAAGRRFMQPVYCFFSP
jgi:hypothetical protein